MLAFNILQAATSSAVHIQCFALKRIGDTSITCSLWSYENSIPYKLVLKLEDDFINTNHRGSGDIGNLAFGSSVHAGP